MPCEEGYVPTAEAAAHCPAARLFAALPVSPASWAHRLVNAAVLLLQVANLCTCPAGPDKPMQLLGTTLAKRAGCAETRSGCGCQTSVRCKAGGQGGDDDTPSSTECVTWWKEDTFQLTRSMAKLCTHSKRTCCPLLHPCRWWMPLGTTYPGPLVLLSQK